MKIPFDIKYRPYIESGDYKVRRADGRPARIVCWDYKSQFEEEKLFVLITNPEGYEYGCAYREDGQYIGNNDNYLVIDDGMTPEIRWEDSVRQILRSYASMNVVAEKMLEAAIYELNLRKQDEPND